MKKIYLFTVIAILAGLHVSAQPVLTAGNRNPHAGEVFFGHLVDTAGKDKGASGAGVTWLLPSDPDIKSDTITYMNCVATPVCDSFPESNIAVSDGTDYTYYFGYTGGFALVGFYAGGQVVHLRDMLKQIAYPLSYGSISRDTGYTVIDGPFPFHMWVCNTVVADGWGSLRTPSGVFANTLRVHTTTITKDSVNFGGIPSVNYSMTEEYSWYAPDFHHSLLTMSYDTIGSGTSYLTEVKYFTRVGTTVVPGVRYSSGVVKLYPNPAADYINIGWEGVDDDRVEIDVKDILGRCMIVQGYHNNRDGVNEIRLSTSGYPKGIYIVTIHSKAYTATQKFAVDH